MDWFRMYTDVLDSPKVQRLPPELFKAWVNILCLTSRCDGVLPPIDEIAFALRMPDSDTAGIVERLVKAGLLDKEGDSLIPHNWHGRQYKSDTSTERVKRFREKRSGTLPKRFSNGDETAPDTETEQKQKRERATRPNSLEEVQALFKERGYTNPDVEAEAFLNYYTANGWVIGRGRAPCKDWKAAAATWNKNAKQYATERSNGKNSAPLTQSGVRSNVFDVTT